MDEGLEEQPPEEQPPEEQRPEEQPPEAKSKTPRRLGFTFLASLALFAVTRGCSSVNAPPSWLVGTGWFFFASTLVIGAIWTWEYTAEKHIGLRIALSVLALAVFAVGAYPSIREQYRREH